MTHQSTRFWLAVGVTLCLVTSPSGSGVLAAELSRSLPNTPESWSVHHSAGLKTYKVTSEKGPQGEPVVRVEYEFKDNGGYLSLKQPLALDLPGDFTIDFGFRGTSQQEHVELKLVDKAGENVWWRQYPGSLFKNEWSESVLHRADFEHAWGTDAFTPLAHARDLEFVVIADRPSKGVIWLKGVHLKAEATADPHMGLRPFDPDCDRPSARNPLPQIPCVEPPARSWPTGENDNRAKVAYAMAQEQPLGALPKYLRGKQSYWTTVPTPENATRGTASPPAILNQEGMVELGHGVVSLTPLVRANGRLYSWADSTRTVTKLEEGVLPIPSSTWTLPGLELTTTAFAPPTDALPVTYVKYAIKNTTKARQKISFYTGMSGLPVNPPWQYPSVTQWMRNPADRLEYDGERVLALQSGPKSGFAIVPLTKGHRFGAKPFADGPIYNDLARGALPAARAVTDPARNLSGALAYELEIAPGATSEIYLAAAPVGPDRSHSVSALTKSLSTRDPRKALPAALEGWRGATRAVTQQVSPALTPLIDAQRAAVGQILANRKGPILQPGPRRYDTGWIRDGAVMASALMQMGVTQPARDFFRWFAQFQRADGFVPCCVTDGKVGPDYLEYDSNGQFIYLLSEIYDHTGDRKLVEDHWPQVAASVDFIKRIRETQMTPEIANDPEKRAFYGLMPASVSHEGYLGNPVHAYWDDFWTLRGIKDAVRLAKRLGKPQAAAWEALEKDFRQTLFASIRRTIADKKLNHIPASAELGDYDPSAIAMAFSVLGEHGTLPPVELKNTIDTYWGALSERLGGTYRTPNYSAYEMRMIEPLVRLGERDKANEALRFFLREQPSPEWKQWPEITWRNKDAPTNVGDQPHTWIAAEYIKASRSMFAYEDRERNTLVLGAGLPTDWFSAPSPIEIKDLPTSFGNVSYTLTKGKEGRLKLAFSGDFRSPPSGIELPLPKSCRVVSDSGRREKSLIFATTTHRTELASEFLIRCDKSS